MKPRVCGHYVLIKQDKVEEVTQGGIVIPEKHRQLEQNATYTGVIADIGETAWYDYCYKYGEKVAEKWAKVGDRVVFTKYGHRSVEIPDSDEEDDYVVVNDGGLHTAHAPFLVRLGTRLGWRN